MLLLNSTCHPQRRLRFASLFNFNMSNGRRSQLTREMPFRLGLNSLNEKLQTHRWCYSILCQIQWKHLVQICSRRGKTMIACSIFFVLGSCSQWTNFPGNKAQNKQTARCNTSPVVVTSDRPDVCSGTSVDQRRASFLSDNNSVGSWVNINLLHFQDLDSLRTRMQII